MIKKKDLILWRVTLNLKKKVNDPSPSPIVSDPTVTNMPRVPYPQALDAPFPSRKDK